MAKNEKGFTIPDGVASDIVVFSTAKDKVLLIERKNEPVGFSLPGGFLDPNETLLTCAVRELKEETSIAVSEEDMTLIGVFSEPNRDPRGRIISAAYSCVVDEKTMQNITAGDDASAAHVISVHAVLNGEISVVFDHRAIIEKAWRV